MNGALEPIVHHINFWVYVILMMIGLYAMIAKRNLMKKLIGMGIFQSAVILFYVSISVKEDADIPIISHDHSHGAEVQHVDTDKIENPLPHVLMLTAIVVGVATLGVGLAIVQKIHRDYGTIEEHELLAKIRAEEDGELKSVTAGGDG